MRYVCPKCGAGGSNGVGKPHSIPTPKCHICKEEVFMEPDTICVEIYNIVNGHKCIPFPPTENVVIADDVMTNLKKHVEPCCPPCGIKRDIYSHRKYGELCSSCRQKNEEESKRKWLAERKYTKTIEERIAEIESFMYDHMKVPHSNPFNNIMR